MSLYKDMRENFPHIFSLQMKAYLEDSFDSENSQKPVAIYWKKSRNTVKRSSKQSSAARHIHEIESQLDIAKIFPDKNKALVLRFHAFLDGRDGYFAVTNIGDFEIRPQTKHVWIASWKQKKAYGKNPAQAMAHLCGLKWAEFRFESKKFYYTSLYDFYREIFFEFPESKKKKPRNNTLKIRDVEGFRMAWQGLPTPKLRIPAYTPPANPHKPNFTVKMQFESEKSHL